jgi:hypothetical protein
MALAQYHGLQYNQYGIKSVGVSGNRARYVARGKGKTNF